MTSTEERDAYEWVRLAAACDSVACLFLSEVTDLLDVLADLCEQTFASPEEGATVFATLQQTVFGFDAFPYANVYLDDECLAGGEGGQIIGDVLTQFKRKIRNPKESADHFGNVFGALRDLLLAAVEFWRHGEKTQSKAHIEGAGRLLRDVAVPSMIPFCASIEQRDEAFARNLATVLRGLTENLCKCAVPGTWKRFASENTPPQEDAPLDEVMRFLLAPNRSGFFLGKNRIQSISHNLNLPCGFSTREDMLTNLFHAAGNYGQTQSLIASLVDAAHTARDALRGWDLPHYEILTVSIYTKIENTTSLLRRLKERARVQR